MPHTIEEAAVGGTDGELEALQSMPFFGQEQNVEQLIVFVLGDEEFGLKIDEVREIIRMRTITPIPDSPSFIRGIINVRGEIVIAIDLKSRFSLHSKTGMESRHIVISRQEKAPFGLIVDEVAEVLRIPKAQIRKTPGLVTRIHEEYISGVLTIENRMIIVLDLAKVLSEDELVKLAELQRRHVETAETEESAPGVEEQPSVAIPPGPRAAGMPEQQPRAKVRGRRGS